MSSLPMIPRQPSFSSGVWIPEDQDIQLAPLPRKTMLAGTGSRRFGVVSSSGKLTAHRMMHGVNSPIVTVCICMCDSTALLA